MRVPHCPFVVSTVSRKKVAWRSVKDEMAERFATLIASCALNVGDTLPNKRDLAVTMGVSREITRGALLILSTKSLVTVVHGSRTKIASGDPARFGLIIVVHLALGMITPPPGVNLWLPVAWRICRWKRSFRSWSGSS